MKIIRILNNNVIHAYDRNGEEIIAMGKGIAFNAKENNIDEEKIEKVFHLHYNELPGYMEKMMSDIPEEYWAFANEMADVINKELGIEIGVSFLVSLIDHIYVSIDRYRKQFDLPDLFSAETRYAYPEIYAVAMKIVEKVNAYFDVKLSGNEAGYIALHLIDAKVDKNDSVMMKISELINQIMEIVEEDFSSFIDKESDGFNRFLLHLKLFAQRVILNELSVEEKKYSKIYSALSADFTEQSECVKKIRKMIRKEYKVEINMDEMSYLLIYLVKLTVR